MFYKLKITNKHIHSTCYNHIMTKFHIYASVKRPLSVPIWIYHQLDSKQFISVKFEHTNFLLRKWIWECHLPKGGHFISCLTSQNANDLNIPNMSFWYLSLVTCSILEPFLAGLMGLVASDTVAWEIWGCWQHTIIMETKHASRHAMCHSFVLWLAVKILTQLAMAEGAVILKI